METWKECGWAQCRKRFEPTRRSNRYQRQTNARHHDAIYCSRACRQKAYRWRSRVVTQLLPGTDVRRAVTRPFHHIENIEVFRTKNEHPRPSFSLSDSYVYSDWQPWPPSTRCTGNSVLSVTAYWRPIVDRVVKAPP